MEIKVSEMIEAESVNDEDLIMIVQNGVNKKVPASKVGTGQAGGDTLPIGAVMEWKSDIIPINWLLCDGQAVSRTDYSKLFEVLGTRYGEGDGSTTFNLPNRKGNIAVGKDENDTDFNTLGKTGGEKTHTLTVNEMPAHTHTFTGTYYALMSGGGSQEFGPGSSKSTEVKMKSAGGGQAHNNMQPYVVSNFIIKAKQSAGVIAQVIDNLESTSEKDALSAKQGKILNEKIEATEKNIITANAIGTTTTAGTNKQLALTEQCKVGDKLSIVEGKVKIGKGIKKVLVYAKALFDDKQVTNSFFYLKHNEIIVNRSDVYGLYNTVSLPGLLLEVKEDDTLSLLINTGTNASVYDGTYLTVEVVE